MKVLEWLAGVLTAVLTVPFLLVGGIVGLFEIPRYLRLRSK